MERLWNSLLEKSQNLAWAFLVKFAWQMSVAEHHVNHLQVEWLPGSMVKLAVAAQQQVFVYDLSVAADTPLVVIQLSQTQARLTAFTIFRKMSLPADKVSRRHILHLQY